MTKRLRRTILFAVIVVAILLSFLAYRLLARASKDSASASAAASNATADPRALQIGADDVWLVNSDTPAMFVRTLPISGTVQAARSTWVKASSMGVLQSVTVREGDAVKKGQVLATLDARDAQQRLVQAQAQVQSAQSQLDTALRTQRSNAALVQQGFISTNAAASSDASAQQAQTALQSARAAHALAQKAVHDLQLRAPFDAQVAQSLVQAGDRVTAEARLIELVDLSRLELLVKLNATDASVVRTGQSAKVWADAGATMQTHAAAQPMLAQVTRISPAAQANNRSVAVWLTLEQPPKSSPALRLRHNQFVQGSIELECSHSTVVPVGSIRLDKPEPYVQIIRNQQVVHRKVQLGALGNLQTPQGLEHVRVVDIANGTTVLRGSLGSLPEGTSVQLMAQ